MSTNNPENRPDVSRLGTLQQRYRLEGLLESRYDTAVTAVEQLSHNVASTGAMFAKLLELEDTIRLEYPDTYAQRWQRWVLDDAARLHAPGVLVIGCSICSDTATAKGLNLESPDAA